MSFLLLIHEPRGQRQTRSGAEGQEAYAAMLRFGEGLAARGLLVASESLRPASEGVGVSVRNGQRTMVDGPFAEAKEFVGGFFLLRCQSRDEAVAIAAECPAAGWASVEVREIAPCYI